MVWFVKGVWILLINAFILPLLMYGSEMHPDSLDSRFGAHVLVTIIVAIYMNSIIDGYMEKA